MPRHDAEIELKKLSISLMGDFANLWKITFFLYPKPNPNTHILERLKWKNDKEYRIRAELSGASDYLGSFSTRDTIKYGILFHIQMNYPSLELPYGEAWKDLNQVIFTRSDLQKFINIK